VSCRLSMDTDSSPKVLCLFIMICSKDFSKFGRTTAILSAEACQSHDFTFARPETADALQILV
jgi:hypothetical protein